MRLRWVLGVWTAFVSLNLNPPSGQSGSGALYKQSISGGAPILVDNCSKTGGCEKVTFRLPHGVTRNRTVGRDNQVALIGGSQNKYSTTNHGQGCRALFRQVRHSPEFLVVLVKNVGKESRVEEKKVVPRNGLEPPLSYREADFKLYIENPKNI